MKPKPADMRFASELSDAEQDLLSHMEQGWQLETDSLVEAATKATNHDH